MESSKQHPLNSLCKQWREVINSAIKRKRTLFQNDADEAMHFLDGEHNWMFSEKYAKKKEGGYLSEPMDDDAEKIVPPSVQIQINKVAEVRDLFGPALYHHNPTIEASPLVPPQVAPQALGIQPPQIDPMTGMPLQVDPMTGMPIMVDPAWQQYEMLAQQQQQTALIKETTSTILQYTLNYFQQELDKKTEARNAIDEALIKGAGLLWTELIQRDGHTTAMVGSFYKDVNDLVVDPDARQWDDVKWVALRCVHPYWEVEKTYNLEPDSLKKYATHESSDRQAANEENPDANYDRANGKSNDLIVYWKIWSKMGLGDRLRDMKKKWDGAFDELGDYCYLVIAADCPFPLNLPDDLLQVPAEGTEENTDDFQLPRDPVMEPVIDPITQQPAVDHMTGEPVEQPAIDPETGEPQTQLNEAVFLACQWPIPFWSDKSWPFEMLGFHWKPGQVWPISHIKPGIGELRFINYMMSYLAVKIRRSSLTKVGLISAIGEDAKAALLSGKDFDVVAIEETVGRSIKDIVSYLEAPDWHPQIWQVYQAVFDLFDKRMGLTELMYGMSGAQLRSAAEANVKQQNISIRPDDMAGKVEDFMSRVAAKEAFAQRWLLTEKDMEPILGPLGAMFWRDYVMSTDLETVVREFDYRVAAGSTRKPDTAVRAQQATEAVQVWGPIVQQYMGQTGDVNPINQLGQFWAEATTNPYVPQFQPPPMPQPQEPPQEAPV
jgi:hypothetical protein